VSLERLGVSKGTKLAVAVSGGADSTALLLLAKRDYEVIAVTVDHGLRAEAADEAALVAALCSRFDIPHVSLTWEGDKPSSGIQAAAREARYKLMADYCLDNDIQHLATAHHMDDQAETIMLRLARGSGVYGLAGMAPTRDLGGVTLVRPLMEVSKAVLIDYLEAEAVDWAEDPSNRSHAFDRVKVRDFLLEPPLEGLRAERLAATAARMRRSRDALEYYEAKWLGQAATVYPEGYVVFNKAALGTEPEEIMLRGIASLCRFVGGGDYVPRMEKLMRLYAAMHSERFSGQTLYGTKISPMKDDKLLFTRELGAVRADTSATDTIVWDNRFEISLKGDIAGIKICPLGEEGWRQIKAAGFSVENLGMPRLAALALPALFSGAELVIVPHLGYNAGHDLRVQVAPIRTILTKK
jgi:tRNA(Ile)-lysidine synthase